VNGRGRDPAASLGSADTIIRRTGDGPGSSTITIRGGQRPDRALTWRVIIGLIVFAIFFLRQPTELIRPQFVWEEAGAYWAMSFVQDPVHFLFDPWVGYLSVPPRAVFLLTRLGPPEIAPAVGDVMHGLIVAAVSIFLLSDRLGSALPDRRLRIGFALALPLLPITEPFGSPLSMQWFLAVYLAALALADGRRWYDVPFATLAVLSGFACAIAAPLFWWRRDRLSVAVTAGAAVQFALVAQSSRHPLPFDAVALVLRASIPGSIVILLAVVAARSLPLRTLVAFGYLGVVTAAMGVLAMGLSVGDPSVGSRYFFALAACVALIAMSSTLKHHAEGAVLAGLLIAGSIHAFSAPVLPDTNWAANARCIGGPVPCTVPIVPPEWSVVWPGNDSYRMRSP
jgi:hypothetical protein